MTFAVDEANGTAERILAGAMLDRTFTRHDLWPKTLGMDAGYKDGNFLDAVEQTGIVPHVPVGDGPIVGDDPGAQARRRAKRRAKSKGYGCSQRIRKRIEEIFGWCKMIAGLGRARFVGRWKIKLRSEVTGAASNLLRLARLRTVS